MNKKTMLIFSLSLTVLAILMSGCIGSTDAPEATTVNEDLTAADLIVVRNIPAGFEYLGAPPTSVDNIKHKYVDVAGIVDAAEGIYQDADSVELHITVVELEDSDAAESFVIQYKSGFTPLRNGDRFTYPSFNGHTVTRIVDYSIMGGEQVARHSYLWSNGNFVFIVDGTTEDFTVIRALAEATGQ